MSERSTAPNGRYFAKAWNFQTALDLLFALVLPIACLALDPGIISRGSYGTADSLLTWIGPGFLYKVQLPLYLLIVLVIAGFWLSFVQGLPEWVPIFLRGLVILGALLSSSIALVLTPLAVGILVSYGVANVASESIGPFDGELMILAPFGFVPIFTAWRYLRRYRCMQRQHLARRLVPFGFIVPVILSVALYVVTEWTLGPIFQRLQSREPDEGLAALNELVEHPLCYSGCRDRVLVLYCTHKARLPAKDLPPLFSGEYGGFLTSEENCAFAW